MAAEGKQPGAGDAGDVEAEDLGFGDTYPSDADAPPLDLATPRERPGGPEAPTLIVRGRKDNSTAGTAVALPGPADPHAALLLEEVERTRVFATMCLFLAVFTVITLPFMGGDERLRNLLIAAMGGNFFTSLFTLRRFRDPANYSPRIHLVFAVFAVATTHLAVLYWSPLGPAPLLFVLGLYFFSRGESFASVITIYVLSALGQALWVVLILGGVMPDVGLYRTIGTPLHVHVASQIVLQFTFLAAFTLARETRKSTLKGIESVLEARRHVAQRDAMFEEVKQDLDRVLQIGGPGRHSDKVLAGYRLGVVVGRGAMGEVYEAIDEGGQVVAIKLLHPNVLAQPGSVERFLREARAAGQLRSPHVCRVLDAAEPTAPTPYLVMELLRGHDLAYHLRKRRRLGRERLEELIRQVGSALDEAGGRGIVHRDVKPQNLFLAEQRSGPPIWKVLDFGASKLAEHSGTLTEGKVVGTPGYMAPEQARGENVTPAADVYALAAISYRCLTGRPPFSFREVHTCLYNVCYGMPPQPTRMTELPIGVDAVLAVGMAKQAGERFRSAAEFYAALRAALAGQRDLWIEQRAQKLLAELPWGVVPT